MMELRDLIDQLVEDMRFDVVMEWARILGIKVIHPLRGDMWPDWQSELRVKVADAMDKVGTTLTKG